MFCAFKIICIKCYGRLFEMCNQSMSIGRYKIEWSKLLGGACNDFVGSKRMRKREIERIYFVVGLFKSVSEEFFCEFTGYNWLFTIWEKLCIDGGSVLYKVKL